MLPDIDSLPSHAVSTHDQTSDDQLLANMPHLADRIRHHTKKLWAVTQRHGQQGVSEYKARYPEARQLHPVATVKVGQGKPAGYDDYLANLAGRWLADEKAVASTNADDVQALNERFGVSQFNPANHFSKPISKRTKAKIHEAFAARGIPLDMAGIKSMSDVRRAAKAAQATAQAGSRPFGGIGTRTDDQLLSGRAAFSIMQHHGKDGIKISVDGARVWLRLDALEKFIRLAGLIADRNGGGSPPSPIEYEYIHMGDLVPNAISPTLLPASDSETREVVPDKDILQLLDLEAGTVSPLTEIVDVVPNTPPTMKERIAALVAAQPQSTTFAHDPDVDPLTL